MDALLKYNLEKSHIGRRFERSIIFRMLMLVLFTGVEKSGVTNFIITYFGVLGSGSRLLIFIFVLYYLFLFYILYAMPTLLFNFVKLYL